MGSGGPGCQHPGPSCPVLSPGVASLSLDLWGPRIHKNSNPDWRWVQVHMDKVNWVAGELFKVDGERLPPFPNDLK